LKTVPTINRAFLPADYQNATEGIDVRGMVFVQCEAEPAHARQEVAWVTEQARTDPRIRGIVARAPVENGEAVRSELDALSAYPLVRGVRRIIQFESDVDFCLKPDFIRGVKLLPQFNLTFDLCIKGDEQFDNTIALARRCPEVTFILDHAGKPDIKQRRTEPWRVQIRKLAGLPNVYCKLSGMVTEADPANWNREDLKPYIDHVVECFGFDRILFGGDWPVVMLASTLPKWVNALDWAIDASESDRQKLFFRNAERVYRLSK